MSRLFLIVSRPVFCFPHDERFPRNEEFLTADDADNTDGREDACEW